MSFITAIDQDGRAIPKGSRTRPAKYVARWRTPDGRSREKRFDRKVDAEQHLTAIGHRMLVGDYVDAAAGRITFGEYSAGWLERKRATVKPTTVETFGSHLRRHLLPVFGTQRLSSITREQVKAFAGDLSTRVAPTTARAVVFTLAAVLREAVDDNRLTRNPAERITVGRKTERRVDPLHVSRVAGQVPAIADAMPERWRAAVLLMAATGLRLGECLGLTLDRVDFLRRSIRVDRQLANVAGGSGFGTPKTRAGVRSIPVPSSVIEMLAAHLSVFPPGPDGLMFTMANGAPVARTSWSDSYRAACRAAGVEGRTRTHDLRHVAASALIASGLSVAAVQAVLGHSSPAETLEVYTHFWPTDEERTRDAIERAAASWAGAAR